MKAKLLLTLAVASICSWQSAWAQDEVVANVTMKEKNSLSNEILAVSGIDDLKTVTHLTVTTNEGVQLGDEDWTTLKSMAALVELDLSNASATEIPTQLFAYDLGPNIVTIKLPKDLTTIGSWAFSSMKSLVTVVVPSTVTSIEYAAFFGSEILEDCDLSACQLESIPYGCFRDCFALKPFEIPSTVKSIGESAFSHCHNFVSSIPAGIEFIERYAFYEAAMTDIDVVIPEGVTIGSEAFRASGIKSLELPTEYYRYDGWYAGCYNLQTLTLKSPTLVTRPGWCYDDITLRVPSHLVAAYKSDPMWSKYKDVVAITPPVTSYIVNADLNLSNSYMRVEGEPSMLFNPDASLTIAGAAPQVFNNFTTSKLYGKESWGGRYETCPLIFNENADVTVNGDYMQRMIIKWEKTWIFLSMPFDFKVSDVTADNGSFVIRTYDGAHRNAEDVSFGNWSGNLTGDVEIKAGTGFIVQTSEETTLTFKAKAGGTNYVFCKESDELKLPLAANNSNAEASVANTGWNMVGNPWQTYYNIHKMNYTAPFAVYNFNGSKYETYSPADDDYALQPFQALFVQCPSGIESIDFPADGRQLTSEITSQNGARSDVQSGRRLFDIEVSDGERSDKTRLVVNGAATMDYEIGRDASKFLDSGSATPQIWSLDADGTQYAINERPADSGTLRLAILFAEDGEYTLQAVRNDIGQVILTDQETGIKTDLQQHAYTFDAEAGLSDSRFTLSFGGAVTGISTAVSSETVATEVYTLDGAKVGTTTEGLQKGVYVVRQGQHTQKVIVK